MVSPPQGMRADSSSDDGGADSEQEEGLLLAEPQLPSRMMRNAHRAEPAVLNITGAHVDGVVDVYLIVPSTQMQSVRSRRPAGRVAWDATRRV